MKKKRILLIEPDVSVARDCISTLLKSGYEVVDIVDSGEEGIQLTTQLRPDLVIMDIAIEGPMTCTHAASAIWQAHHIPILFLTDHSHIGGFGGANQTKPFAYLVRSCDAKTLLTSIAQALGLGDAKAPYPQEKKGQEGAPGGKKVAIERRRHPRYRVADGAIAVSAGGPGQILNISMGGVAFTYMDSQESPWMRDKVHIMDGMKNLLLKDISSRVVSRRMLPSKSSFSKMWMIQCAMEFVELSETQRSDLAFYLDKHCVGQGLGRCE